MITIIEKHGGEAKKSDLLEFSSGMGLQYQVAQTIRGESSPQWQRGRRLDDGQAVLLKSVAGTDELQVQRLQREFILAQRYQDKALLQVLDLYETDESHTLVLTDPGGAPLEALLAAGSPLPLANVLAIGCQLARTLARLHQRDLIHRDISVANIWVDVPESNVWLSSIGNASAAHRERASVQNISSLLLDPRYIAPEQSGRIDRLVDYRADYYSLGVVLFQMLTGQVPFSDGNLLELTYAHIAQSPPTLSGQVSDIPEIVESIVLKLLAKAPEQRYQSGWGIAADLERCLLEWVSNGNISTFELAQQDVPLRFELPRQLYGRTEEIAQLSERFAATCAGNARVMLISGASGVGKTALVGELRQQALQQNGFFVSGKCDQQKQNEPYTAFRQAFRQLAQRLLGLETEQLQTFRKRFQTALKNNLGVIVEFAPEFGKIIGAGEPAPTLEPKQMRNRLHYCLRQLLTVCASAEHPLVLFIDDLQWLDDSSLALLDHILSRLPPYSLLLGAYRDNEVSTDSALQQSIAQHRARGVDIKILNLPTLSAQDVEELVAQALHTDVPSIQPLAQLAYQKTAGSPLLLNVLLTSLYDQGCLRFEPGRGWLWDSARIQALQTEESATDLLTSKLRHLSESTKKIIASASLFGNDFAVAQLCLVTDSDPEQIEVQLLAAGRDGVLLKTESGYRFPHDQVQQAAYELMPLAERQRQHLHIARNLKQLADSHSGDSDKEAANILDIAFHLNQASALLDNSIERSWALQIYRQAGRKACANSAFATAYHYYRKAIGLLGPDPWNRQHLLTATLHGETAEAAYFSTDYPTAQQLAESLHQHALSSDEQLNYYRLAADIAYAENRPQQSQRLGFEALELLGIETSPELSATELKTFFADVAQRLDRVLLENPDALIGHEPKYEHAVNMLTSIGYASAWFNMPLTHYCLCRAMELALEHGLHGWLRLVLVNFAASRALVLEDVTGAEHTVAFALQQPNETARKPITDFMINSFVAVYNTPFSVLSERLKDTFRISVELGDRMAAGSCAYQRCVQSLHNGRPLAEVEQLLHEYHAEVVDLKLPMYEKVLLRLLQLVQQLRASEVDEAVLLEELQDYNTPVGVRILRPELMVLHVLRQSQVLQRVLNTETMALDALPGIPNEFYRCLILLRHCMTLDEPQLAPYFKRIEVLRQQLARQARLSPHAYRHRLDLVEAEYLRFQGRADEALTYYARAIQGAQDNAYLQELGLAAERLAECYLQLQQPLLAGMQLQLALSAYQRWGAQSKCRQLHEQYADLLAEQTTQLMPPSAKALPHSAEALRTNSVFAVNTAASPDMVNEQSIRAAAQALAEEIELEPLLHRLMTIVMQNTGAQRGLLIRKDEQNWLIEVTAVSKAGALDIELEQGNADSDNLPMSVIRYVTRGQTPVRISDTASDKEFASDSYFTRHSVKSAMCLPLGHGDTTFMLLYLEHFQLVNAFVPNHYAAAHILATQTASALHNAGLYHQLQQEVAQHKRLRAELQERVAELTELKEKLAAENVYLQQEVQSEANFEEMIGQSTTLRQVQQQLDLVARTKSTVLITGETGTGKELIARALHQRSGRSQHPMIKVNCAALPATLIESELFGHEKGAFTGAMSRKIGRFELADNSTLFLDEIGELSLDLQVKLLRVLQEGEFERLGSSQVRKVDVRIIAATNRDLEQMIHKGEYRADLYYRLNTFPIHLPALRERREDIPLLVSHFIAKHQTRLDRRIDKIPATVMETLQSYHWPGNIRELENLVERALIMSTNHVFRLDKKSLPSKPKPVTATVSETIPENLREIERDHIVSVLKQCNWKIQGSDNAAERLGLKPSTLRWKMKKLGIRRT